MLSCGGVLRCAGQRIAAARAPDGGGVEQSAAQRLPRRSAAPVDEVFLDALVLLVALEVRAVELLVQLVLLELVFDDARGVRSAAVAVGALLVLLAAAALGLLAAARLGRLVGRRRSGGRGALLAGLN